MYVQGMFKQIQTLVTSSASSAAAAPADAASALFSQLAASEYRRQSMEPGAGGGVADLSDHDALRAEEEAEEIAKRSLVEATLLKEQEAGVAAVVAVAETQKKNLEDELEQAGATVEEKKVGHTGAPTPFGRITIYDTADDRLDSVYLLALKRRCTGDGITVCTIGTSAPRNTSNLFLLLELYLHQLAIISPILFPSLETLCEEPHRADPSRPSSAQQRAGVRQIPPGTELSRFCLSYIRLGEGYVGRVVFYYWAEEGTAFVLA